MERLDVAEIEAMQEKLRKKAEEVREKDDDVYKFIRSTIDFMDRDKLFVSPPELLNAYRETLAKIWIGLGGGLSLPISQFITSTSNDVPSEQPWWKTTGGSKVLRYFQDLVIDAVTDITSLNPEYTDDTRLFLIFLSEIKFKGVRDFTKYCESLATTITLQAASSNQWKEEVYEIVIEFAESFSEVKRIERERGAEEDRQALARFFSRW